MSRTKIVELKTNFQVDPIGIESTNVNFSWKMASNRRGAEQQKYQIIVTKGEQIIWNSDEVVSRKSFAISCPMQFEMRTIYNWHVKILDELGNWITSDYASFETGVTGETIWEATPFICLEGNTEIAPVFLFEKQLSKNLVRARIYLTAIGAYQLAVNGKVFQSDSSFPVLNPGYGNGEVSLFYQTYDITPFLQETSDLHLAIIAGNGWAAGMGETSGRPAIKAMIVLTNEYTEEIHVTDTQNWQASLDGAVRKNGIYYGEEFDANYMNITEFYHASPALVPLTTTNFYGKIVVRDGLQGVALTNQALSAVAGYIYQGEKLDSTYIGGEIKLLNCWVTEQGQSEYKEATKIAGDSIFSAPIDLADRQTLLIDFGQNITAVPFIKVKAPRNTQIRMRFSEMLNDGREWDTAYPSIKGDGPKGAPYFKNLRNAQARVLFISSDKEIDTYSTSFSFFGYRYMTIEVDQPIEILVAKSIPLSSIKQQIGFLDTNNSAVNQLIKNVRYGQLSNYFTTATDCPQRDERLFWSGDTQVFAQTALFNYDSVNFLSDILKIMVENTLIKGYTPMVVDCIKDEYFSAFSAGWSDALIIVAWTLFLHTGNKETLLENYPAFLVYLDFLERNERMPHAAPLFNDRNCGDWLSFQGTNVAMMGDYFYAYTLSLLEKIACQLGKKQDAIQFHRKFEAIKDIFFKNHVIPKATEFVLLSGNTSEEKYQFCGQGVGRKGGVWEDNSQTALLWFLKLEFYQDEEMKQRAINLLIENIRNNQPSKKSVRSQQSKNSLAIGFLGVNVIAPTLTDYGAADIAYDLLLQTENPSWLFEVEAGATTIWERWNSYDSKIGFGDSEMNSFNHYSYGAIVEWLYTYMLGITMDQSKPGFQQIILQPTVDQGEKYNHQDRINRVNGRYLAPYGEITVNWESEDGKLINYCVSLPANMEATLYLPVKESQVLTTLPYVLTGEPLMYNSQQCLKFHLKAGDWQFRLSGF